MDNISFTLNFNDSDFCKKYFKAYRQMIARRQFLVRIFLFFFILFYFIGSWVTSTYASQPIYTSEFFLIFFLGCMLLIWDLCVPYRKSNQLQKEVVDMTCGHEVTIVFSSIGFSNFKDSKFIFDVEYNSLRKIKITKIGFVLVISAGRALFLPRILLTKEEQEQLILWLKK